VIRFDKPCLKVAGAVEYFREHLVGDYLAQQGQSPMSWHGRAAARQGLNGHCQLSDFTALCQGRDPATGSHLGMRHKPGLRRICFFAQLSAPKDVSIAALVAGDDRILHWWDESVRETLLEIEALTATRVRRNGANSDRSTGEMIAAVVTHDTNRALDPQLHTHVCIFNLTFDAVENRWKGVQPSGYYRHQGYLREVCYNHLARRLLAGGYTLEPARNIGFHLTGFPPELRERFSKRRRAILAAAEARGASSQDELQAITARTRASKTAATAATLRSGWVAEAGELLEPVRKVLARALEQSRVIPDLSPEAVASAERHLFERHSVVDARTLLREALRAGRGHVELSALHTAIEDRVNTGALLRSGADLACAEGLAAEREFVAWANRHRASAPALGRTDVPSELADDQLSVVRAVLASRSRVTLFQGDAGTGKTTCLRTIVAAIERSGSPVFGCAPSAGATDVLRRELTPSAETLQQLLVNPQLQSSLRGHVIVVDEAGLLSVREMHGLCRLAEERQCRLLLVGDIKQHSSVEAGDALRCLQQYAHLPAARLSTIRRQTDFRYRAAVAHLARGDAYASFNAFTRLGAVHECRNPRQLLALAAEDYVQTVRAGKSCLVISPVWSEIHRFTEEVRTRLRHAGVLRDRDVQLTAVVPLKWTREERRRPENYRTGDILTFFRDTRAFARHEQATVLRRDDQYLTVQRANGAEYRFDPRHHGGFEVGIAQTLPIAPGDRLLLRANLAEQHLKNGDLVTVAALPSSGEVLLTDGRTIPAHFRHFTHGYANTSHSAQGKTVDRGILLMGEEGIAAGNLKQAYVSNSRFRESQMIYTTDLAAAREAMSRHADRMLGSELLGPNSGPAPSLTSTVSPSRATQVSA
jgi:conjugative relaxase-like TrwC/TraI family protein